MRLGLLLLFIPVLLLGSIYYLHMERTLRHEQQQNLIARNTQYFHTLIEPYLATLKRQFTLIYQQVNYQDFSGPEIRHGERYLQQWQAYHEVMELDYVYVGTEHRKMLIHPSWQADEKFDPRTRPWYLLAASHPNQMVWTDPYYDYTLGTLTMALARVIEDPDGKRVGVLSLDTQLTPLASWLNGRHEQSHHLGKGYQILLNHDGLVLAHPDRERVFKPLAAPDWLARMHDDQGFFLDDASGMMVSYYRIPEQRWILLSIEPTASMQQVIDSVSVNVQLMIALACILYLLLALLWARYFRRMLGEITQLIRASRSGGIAYHGSRMLELAKVYEEMDAASQDFAQIRLQANQDKLTGLYNRRFFDECLQKRLNSGAPFGLVMFDLDDFKQVNDTHGHQAGDVVLKRVSKLGMHLFDQWGWFCRYGGEELVLVFRLETPMSEIASLLEAFRLAVEKLEWREPGLTVTISGGVAFSHSGLSAKTLVELADSGVYQAKREGKNRICFPQCRVSDLMDEDPPPHLDQTRRHAH
ncbi:sensor domain-containing diguanylate cyclase [Aeromonas allosaccharophila]|uniref:diguanylate cyclase n=2 Tax=Aeromonas allosaccharophila TaxID=656 RepID=A0AAX3NXV2_9GAMM|nr:sensor domain-containing diguanylate cyclase [Aeromonas allosaccharophila]WED76973.1 sensor domain-containing diguanylate cyclase [Aeromonas allosaccharophila]